MFISKRRTFIGFLVCALCYPNLSFSQQSAESDSRAFIHFTNGMLLERAGNLDEAIREYQAALRYESDPTIWKSLGDLYIFKKSQYELGAAAYERYLESNPNDERTIDIVVQIYGQMQRYARVEKLLTGVIAKGNDKPIYYRYLTDFYLKDGKVKDAQNTAVLYIKASGISQNASVDIANVFKQNNKIIEGIDFFSKYYRDNSDEDNVGIVIGLLEESRKNMSGAEKAYISVLKKNEAAYIARAQLGALYINTGQFFKALELYEGINFDDPSEVQIRLEIAKRLSQGETPQLERAESILAPATEKLNVTAEALHVLGFIQLRREKDAEAAANLKEAFRKDRSNPLTAYFLATAQYQLENYEEARKAIDHAVQLQPNVKEFYVIQGGVYDKLGVYEKAIESYENGLKASSTDARTEATLYNNYSYLLTTRGVDLEKALDMAKKAILREPDNSSFLDTIGWVHFKLGDIDQAYDYIKKANEKSETPSVDILDHLGDIYMKKGDTKKAKEYWQKAISLDSTQTEIRAKIDKNKN